MTKPSGAAPNDLGLSVTCVEFHQVPRRIQELILKKIPGATSDEPVIVVEGPRRRTRFRAIIRVKRSRGRLYYTPGEWSAWVLGVRDGEFDDMTEDAPADRVIAMRDSKDPDGTKLFVPVRTFKDYLDALKAKKYDFEVVKEDAK